MFKIFGTKDLEYNQKVYDGHRCNWEFGDWTDDSDQMILILRTLVHNDGKVSSMTSTSIPSTEVLRNVVLNANCDILKLY